MLQGASFIIASQYNGLIYDRLRKRLDISDCYVPNYIGETPYHNDSVISFSDRRYSVVRGFLEDDYSRGLFDAIVENRIAESNACRAILIPYEEKSIYNDGFEDYWIRVAAARKNENAVVIDCGAYVGDTVETVCKAIGKGIIKYYAIEPNEDSYNVLSQKDMNCEFYSELIAINSGVGSADEEVYLNITDEFSDASHFSKESGSGKKTKVITIDSMNIESGVDVFIKMDIEGFEMEALRGAENTIRTLKPALAICVYHKENDIIEVPMYLKSLVPEYSLYLTGGSHTICIAQVEK